MKSAALLTLHIDNEYNRFIQHIYFGSFLEKNRRKNMKEIVNNDDIFHVSSISRAIRKNSNPQKEIFTPSKFLCHGAMYCVVPEKNINSGVENIKI